MRLDGWAKRMISAVNYCVGTGREGAMGVGRRLEDW